MAWRIASASSVAPGRRRPATSVRHGGNEPELVRVTPTGRAAAAAAAARRLIERWNTVGVVAPASLADEVRAVLQTATPDFVDHPKVANGASELLVEVLGDEGKHARVAAGAASLPLGACVEVAVVAAVSD